jgi:hypothetical protein
MSSNLSKQQILTLFKDKVIDFFDALIEQFPNEEDFIFLRLVVNDVDVEKLITAVTKAILPHSDMILNKNEKFFLEKCSEIIKSIPDINIGDNKICHFKRIWLSKVLTNEDREILWSWFKLFVQLSKQYQFYIPNK